MISELGKKLISKKLKLPFHKILKMSAEELESHIEQNAIKKKLTFSRPYF